MADPPTLLRRPAASAAAPLLLALASAVALARALPAAPARAGRLARCSGPRPSASSSWTARRGCCRGAAAALWPRWRRRSAVAFDRRGSSPPRTIAGGHRRAARPPAIRRRRRADAADLPVAADVRARLLFLHGAPAERVVVDCGEVFSRSRSGATPPAAAARGRSSRCALPGLPAGPGRSRGRCGPRTTRRAPSTPRRWPTSSSSGRRATAGCSTPSASTSRVRGDPLNRQGDRHPRPPRVRARPPARRGVPALPRAAGGPRRLGRRRRSPQPLPEGRLPLEADRCGSTSPSARVSAWSTRFEVRLPGASDLPTAPPRRRRRARRRGRGDPPGGRGGGRGGGAPFDDFRVRFVLPPAEDGHAGGPLFGEPLRPDQDYLVRFRVTDEVSGRSVYLSEGFRVPS